MPEEKNKVEVGMGTKGEAPSGQEPKQTREPKAEGEVGGRYLRGNTVVCPYCMYLNDIIEETTTRLPFRCWHCGNVFWY